MKKILIGIDGGGSNSTLVVSDEKLNILQKSKGGATNFLKIGLAAALENIKSSISPFLEQHFDSEIYLVIGTAGAGRRKDAEILEVQLKNLFQRLKIVKVTSDAEITLKGAFGPDDGAILIAGTGSILYYKQNNSIKRVGGLGRIIGDEGSGYSIGKNALNHLAKTFDGRESTSELSKLLSSKFSLESLDELINAVYKNNFDIASVAQNVIELAESGDEVSQAILSNEANQLIEHIKALYRNENLSELKLSFAGSLLTNENYYSDLIKKEIKNNFPQIKIVFPKHSPEIGALLIAKELIS